jgi:hypothetical protein
VTQKVISNKKYFYNTGPVSNPSGTTDILRFGNNKYNLV